MRRGNGDGSIYKLSGKRRKPFAVRVTVGWTSEGKQKYKYIGYYVTKSEAKNALNEYLMNPIKERLERKTLENIFNAMVEKSDFSEGTKKQYMSGFNKLELLWKTPIADITLEDLEDIIEPETGSVQSRIKKTLSNCYKHALRYKYVDSNLADFINVTKTKSKPKTPFTLEEIRSVWNNLGNDESGDIPIILLYTGMRISELLDLKLENVNLEDRTIFVEESKSPAGIRHIPIHDDIFDIIAKRATNKKKYLITNNGRKFAYSTYLKEYWNIKGHTPHEARHTFITYLTKRSSDQVCVKKIVGHSLSDITDHYTHRTIEELAEEMRKLKY